MYVTECVWRSEDRTAGCQRQVSAVHTTLDFAASLIPIHYSSTRVTDIHNQIQLDVALVRCHVCTLAWHMCYPLSYLTRLNIDILNMNVKLSQVLEFHACFMQHAI